MYIDTLPCDLFVYKKLFSSVQTVFYLELKTGHTNSWKKRLPNDYNTVAIVLQLNHSTKQSIQMYCWDVTRHQRWTHPAFASPLQFQPLSPNLLTVAVPGES